MSEKFIISKTKDIGLALMRTLPRVSLKNLRHNPNSKKLDKRGRAQHGGDKHGCGQKTSRSRMLISRVGFEGGNFPFYLRPSNEPYYERHHLRRQYPPITLQQLQTMIDTNRLDVTKPIDLVALMRTGLLDLRPDEKHFGFQLKDDGANIFDARINIEVQAATELVIATIERLGGRITTAYYDMQSLQAMVAPEKFYERGVAIPRRMVPPANAIPDYCDAKKRGYLADPAEIEREREILAQKYGYILPEIRDEKERELMNVRKNPVQIFYGLEPGWVINLRKRAIYKPLDGQQVTDYFKNDSNFK